MLVIRDAQLAVFRENDVRHFEEELLEHLLNHYPGPCAALGKTAEVRAFVERAIKRGAQHGIESKGAVTVFAELLLQFGENFERSPLREWTRNILAHPMLPGSAKAGAIRDRHEEETQGRVIVPF